MHLTLAVAFAFQVAGAPGAPPPLPAVDEMPIIDVIGERARKNRRLCKTEVATGSIMPKRTCRTVGEWDEITAASVAAVERARREQESRRFVQESIANQ